MKITRKKCVTIVASESHNFLCEIHTSFFTVYVNNLSEGPLLLVLYLTHMVLKKNNLSSGVIISGCSSMVGVCLLNGIAQLFIRHNSVTYFKLWTSSSDII